ncbi:hypothetical protein [Nesterenkonia pannonica]|uniref:hypothetical protein n=1 Tax=Nesterenkonia pannonica TaxID=1548602 RepID=UPI00216485E1|nr:hypothetical protein [Nesterenkonia pannonica]
MAFRHWDASVRRWETESGQWAVIVGRHADDTAAEQTVEVVGTVERGTGAAEELQDLVAQVRVAQGQAPPVSRTPRRIP